MSIKHLTPRSKEEVEKYIRDNPSCEQCGRDGKEYHVRKYICRDVYSYDSVSRIKLLCRYCRASRTKGSYIGFRRR